MKTTKIIYWTTTIIIFLADGLMPALTSNSELARQGISHLGYPDYFRVMLTVFKIIGAIVLIVPSISARFKEWAYVGFGISFICAAVSNWVVDGFSGLVLFPIVAFVILAVSYIFYHKMKGKKDTTVYTQNFAV
ncbi:DoxX family protein [Panacibacter ginsenosidivorans]|uniref:DoxX family protein n=1 Tax=Panacibacter ginsenosidivorans TaxID=1813871 RepID=A0A5B8VD60_9BACT|nr:DoxX family protein [Panacibacter ginsenosidivorans]QEC69410.1 DoxX family protein [Panacibacter ginsenosidivorans]